MTFLSLFAGIGGFDIGLERAGMTCVGQCEIDPFCLAVLEKHWPSVWKHNDIRTLTGELIQRHCGRVDLVCGGFPCQDISNAGKGAGIDGQRSGLWREMLRVVREVRPRWVFIENVGALRSRGGDRVLGDLGAAGYACQPILVGAEAVGAPHKRARVWIVGYCDSVRESQSDGIIEDQRRRIGDASEVELADAAGGGFAADGGACGNTGHADISGKDLVDTIGDGRGAGCGKRQSKGSGELAHAMRSGCEELHTAAVAGEAQQRESLCCPAKTAWPSGPGQVQHDWEAPRLVKFQVGWTAHGLPTGVVRAISRMRGCTDGEAEEWLRRNKVKIERRQNKEALKAYGNSVVPQIPEMIGRWIMRAATWLNLKGPK